MADDSPVLRGRKVRASREELNPKLARSPGKLTPMGGVLEDDLGSFVKWPRNSSKDEEFHEIRKDSEAPMLRASTIATRPVTDSTIRPEHPVARGRRERESREEVARSSRPPQARETTTVSTSSSLMMMAHAHSRRRPDNNRFTRVTLQLKCCLRVSSARSRPWRMQDSSIPEEGQ